MKADVWLDGLLVEGLCAYISIYLYICKWEKLTQRFDGVRGWLLGQR